MNLEQLYKRLLKAGVLGYRFYLHGLFGENEDNDKLALTIYKRGNSIWYEVYVKERGVTSTLDVFNNKNEACKFMFEKLIYERDLFNILKVEGLEGMTVNERLCVSNLIEEFDEAMIHDKRRAREILSLLNVDEPSINKIIP